MECDNWSVKHILTQKDLTPRQAHWADLLSEYPVNIVHIRGKDNAVADALSRSINTVEVEFDMDEGFKQKVINVWNEEGIRPLMEGNVACEFTPDGLVYYEGWLYLPEDDKLKTQALVMVHHSDAGHLGREKTLELVKRRFYWPGLVKDVEDFVQSCDVCQRTKKITQVPAGLLQPIPPPTRP